MISATINHQKVSAIADGADNALVKPSDWNNSHSIAWGVAVPNKNTISTADADTAGDSNFSSVALLMHMTGANNSQSFVDVTGKAVGYSGNVKLSGASYKFDTTSAYFDGTSDYLTTPITSTLALGTSANWTVECWFNLDDTSYRSIMSLYLNNTTRWSVEITSPTTINCVYMGAFTTPVTMVAGTWYHLALVCTAGATKLYINGIPSETVLGNVNAALTSGTLAIGWTQYAGYDYWFKGYIDDFRITNGVARYSSDFSASLPTIPFYDGLPSVTFDPTKNYVSAGPIVIDGVDVIIPSGTNWVIT